MEAGSQVVGAQLLASEMSGRRSGDKAEVRMLAGSEKVLRRWRRAGGNRGRAEADEFLLVAATLMGSPDDLGQDGGPAHRRGTSSPKRCWPARAMRLGLPMRTVNPNLIRPSRLLPAASNRTGP